jgi:hypothetical protein
MTAFQLIEHLSQLPANATVHVFTDSAIRIEVKDVWLTHYGQIVLADEDERVRAKDAPWFVDPSDEYITRKLAAK